MSVQHVIAVVIMRFAALAMKPGAPSRTERDAPLSGFPEEFNLPLAALTFHVVDGH